MLMKIYQKKTASILINMLQKRYWQEYICNSKIMKLQETQQMDLLPPR